MEGRGVNSIFLNVSVVRRRHSETCTTAEPGLSAIKSTCNQSIDIFPTVHEKREKGTCEPFEDRYAN